MNKTEKAYWKSLRESYGYGWRRIKPQFQRIKALFKKQEENRHKYTDKIIRHASSPSGFAYIGINKQPLMKSGYGYKGVVLQDDYRMFVQCNDCGKWMKRINAQHLKLCSKITIQEYRERHGINRHTGLLSDVDSNEISERATRLLKEGKIKLSHDHKLDRSKNGRKKRFEYMNRMALCPDQIKNRVLEFVMRTRQYPSSKNKGGALYTAVARRFGNFNNALKAYGLPTKKQEGSRTRYSFSDGTEIVVFRGNINDRNILFETMMEKCPNLTQIT